MLIVDMPMPSRCFECFARLSCERYTQELEMVDDFEELKALLPNDKCLIKGELVRCGECNRGLSSEAYGDAKYCMGVFHNLNWYCADGERKEMADERR